MVGRRFLTAMLCGIALWTGLLAASARAADVATDPRTSPIVTDDIARFWHAIDDSTAATRADVLQREYLDPGSNGVHDFIPYRIGSASHLAETYDAHAAYYGAIREASLHVVAQTPAIRAAFVRMSTLVDGAVFPPTYFVIGALNSGGTNSDRALIIGVDRVLLPPGHDPGICAGLNPPCGAEAGPDGTPYLVAHELTHYQQAALRNGRPQGKRILDHALTEGVADFLGTCAARMPLSSLYRTYGDAHYAEIRDAFRNESSLPYEGSDWFYTAPSQHTGWPNDMGYYAGYEIAKAYVGHAKDQHAAIHDLLLAAEPARIVADSGYLDSTAPRPMPTICTGT